jgi:pimeloyl-ACP methyl ester carboxylesterase
VIKSPILVVAGSSDSIVPTDLSRAVYEAALPNAHWALIENAAHNDPALSFDQPLFDVVDQFLDEELQQN